MQTVSYVCLRNCNKEKNEAMKRLAGVDLDDNHVCSRFSSQNVFNGLSYSVDKKVFERVNSEII